MNNANFEKFKRCLEKSYLDLSKELYKYAEPNKNTPHIGWPRQYKLIGSIIMIAFALESFINNYAEKYCKDEFMSLEKLGTKEKWFILPQLIMQRKIFNKNQEPYQSISKIIDLRNIYAHYKPKYKDLNSKQEKRAFSELNFKNVKNMYKNAVISMQKLCSNIEDEEFCWIIDRSQEIDV